MQIMTLVEIEKNHIMWALAQLENNVAKTARIIGMSRATLYRRLNAYQAEKAEARIVVEKTIPAKEVAREAPAEPVTAVGILIQSPMVVTLVRGQG